uniref:Uncharacterized protein OSJNBb0111K12.16 n=1 Tax=Oryza sativa subsp. japonica TaxID=39947 RepID=Q75IS5_ORYSJ|nr:hypothetical protein [Oryza sativa Japonica Group]
MAETWGRKRVGRKQGIRNSFKGLITPKI